MHKSITSTMQGKPPSDKDKQATDRLLAVHCKNHRIRFACVTANCRTPPNAAKSSLTAARRRVPIVTTDRTLLTARFTTSDLDRESDYYDGYNTPSLRGLYRKVRWLHNGAQELRTRDQ